VSVDLGIAVYLPLMKTYVTLRPSVVVSLLAWCVPCSVLLPSPSSQAQWYVCPSATMGPLWHNGTSLWHSGTFLWHNGTSGKLVPSAGTLVPQVWRNGTSLWRNGTSLIAGTMMRPSHEEIRHLPGHDLAITALSCIANNAACLVLILRFLMVGAPSEMMSWSYTNVGMTECGW
jgi:hypothetical protein